jgi:hypothetical protein
MLRVISFLEVTMATGDRDVSINISGIPVAGVGGLGLIAGAALIAYFLPALRPFVALGAVGGILLSIAIVAFRRHHVPSGPNGDDPKILFRAEPAPEGEPARPAPRADVVELATP